MSDKEKESKYSRETIEAAFSVVFDRLKTHPLSFIHYLSFHNIMRSQGIMQEHVSLFEEYNKSSRIKAAYADLIGSRKDNAGPVRISRGKKARRRPPSDSGVEGDQGGV